MKSSDRESAVRISLLDVIYGVILGYGFSFFDRANDALDYLRFFFVYAVIIIDWLYVHRLYWGWEYKHNSFFVIDMGILFAFSRMLITSVTNPFPYFWLWLFFVFAFYVLWDIETQRKHMPFDEDSRYSTAADVVAAILFGGLFLVLWQKVLTPGIWLDVVTVVIYLGAVLTWFKKRRASVSSS